MNPLIALALELAPELGSALFGRNAETITAAVTEAVRAVAGTTDPASASLVLSRTPALSGQLRVELARIAATAAQAAAACELEALGTRLAAPLAAPATARPPAPAYGAPLISLVVLATFAAMLWVTVSYGIPKGAETMANMLLGTIAAMATSVVSYWVGSSAGADRKDAQLANRQQP